MKAPRTTRIESLGVKVTEESLGTKANVRARSCGWNNTASRGRNSTGKHDVITFCLSGAQTR
jgi:hypothetical protein